MKTHVAPTPSRLPDTSVKKLTLNEISVKSGAQRVLGGNYRCRVENLTERKNGPKKLLVSVICGTRSATRTQGACDVSQPTFTTINRAWYQSARAARTGRP